MVRIDNSRQLDEALHRFDLYEDGFRDGTGGSYDTSLPGPDYAEGYRDGRKATRDALKARWDLLEVDSAPLPAYPGIFRLPYPKEEE